MTLTAAPNARLRERVTLFRVGLGDRRERVPLFAQPGNAGNSVLGASVDDLSSESREAWHREVKRSRRRGGKRARGDDDDGDGAPQMRSHVDVVPLDELWAPGAEPSIALLKMDVQGFEARLLRGARSP